MADPRVEVVLEALTANTPGTWSDFPEPDERREWAQAILEAIDAYDASHREQLEERFREVVATLRRIHVHIAQGGIDVDWIKEQAAFGLDRAALAHPTSEEESDDPNTAGEYLDYVDLREKKPNA